MRFACAVGAHFERFVLIARDAGDGAAAPYKLPHGVELAPLPDYPSLRRLGRVLAALPATVRGMWRALERVDVVWVSGVHPFGLLLAGLARMRRRRVALLIRQDSPRYFRTRLPGRAWAPLLAPLRLLDLAFVLLGKRFPTTVVGGEIARRYGAPRPNLLEMRVTLLDRAELAAGPAADAWPEEVALLTVGRIEPEKSPWVAVDALAELERRRPGRFTLTWVGEGRLREALREGAEQRGIGERLRLPGFVPFGPELLGHYREAQAFVHVALTEGVPGVLYEAMGSGLPIVATEVGGIGEALERGAAGILVPPSDPDALAGAVLRLDDDPALRRQLAERGLELARGATIESEGERVAAFLAGGRPA